MKRLRVFVRDKPHPVTGEMPIIGELYRYSDLQAVARRNDVGSWRIVVPAGEYEAELLLGLVENGVRPGPGGKGIVIFIDGQDRPVFSGPINKLTRRWDKDSPGEGVIELSGPDDNVLLQERVAWNSPNRDIHQARAGQVYWQPWYNHLSQGGADLLNATYGTDAYSIYACNHDSGDSHAENAAETIRGILAANLNNSFYDAKPGRALNHVVIPWVERAGEIEDDNSDAYISNSIRFSDIKEVIQRLGELYHFNVRFLWSPKGFGVSGPYVNKIHCRIWGERDLTETVAFAPGYGNMSSYEYTITGPSVTRVVVGTAGNAKNRYFQYLQNTDYNPVGWSDPDGWSALEREWYVTAERFADESGIEWEYQRDTSKPDPWAKDPRPNSQQQYEINRAARQVFEDGAPGGAITMEVINTPDCQYGRDYELGDVVRVLIDGELRYELVKEVEFTASAEDGFRIKPTLGSRTRTPLIYQQMRKMWDRIHGPTTRENLELGPLVTPEIIAPTTDTMYKGSATFSVTGETYPDVRVELYRADSPGRPSWRSQWFQYGTGTADSGGVFTIPNRSVGGDGRPWTKFKVRAIREEDGAKAESLPVYIASLNEDGTLCRPAVVEPYLDSEDLWEPRKRIRCSGYAPPGAQIEIQHRIDGTWQSVSSVQGELQANENGRFVVTFRMGYLYGDGGFQSYIPVRVRQIFNEMTSPWQTETPTGRPLRYYIVSYA